MIVNLWPPLGQSCDYGVICWAPLAGTPKSIGDVWLFAGGPRSG